MEAATARLLRTDSSKQGSLQELVLDKTGKVLQKAQPLDWSHALQTFGPLFCQDAGCTVKNKQLSSMVTRSQSRAQAFSSPALQGLTINRIKNANNAWVLQASAAPAL